MRVISRYGDGAAGSHGESQGKVGVTFRGYDEWGWGVTEGQAAGGQVRCTARSPSTAIARRPQEKARAHAFN